MGKRKHLSWKTKCACVLAWWDGVPYDDLKQLTEDQFLSLYQFDHNILHESGHEDRDKFWNLKPRLIKEHREKTKRDAAIIAKGRRLRNNERLAHIEYRLRRGETLGYEEQEFLHSLRSRRKILSRGFDKTKRRKMSGKVVDR